MTNRLIGLIIILIFLLLGIGYYFGVEKPYNEKQKYIENKKMSTEGDKSLQQEIILNKIETNNNSGSLLSLSNEEKEELKNKNILKIKQKISYILNISILDKINIQEIDGDKNLFLAILEKNNYIYNKKILNLDKIELNIPIIYAKKINYKIYLITEKGTFISQNNKIEYFPLFSDFVINKGNYIGIIKNSDKTRKNNFNFKNISGDLIVLYNPKKSIKKILYKPNFEIKKILLENNNIIIVSENDEKYILEY